jgi:hypothetical protein
MLNNKLEDYIHIVPNAITDNLISKILEEYSNSNEFVIAQVAKGVDETIRKCDSLNISDPNIINKNTARKELDNYLYTSASYVLRDYLETYNITDLAVQGDSGYCMLRYFEGSFYSQHTDHYLQNPRILSCSFALNDDYEGGEFAFFDRKVATKIPKGSAILFPSNFMYPHEIMPVTKGVRYSIITWFI